MSDALENAMMVVKAAAHTTRLSLLLQADRVGTLHTRDAKALLRRRPQSGSGNAQYHLGELLRAGLIKRVARGEYRLSDAGAQLVPAIVAAATPAVSSTDQPPAHAEIVLFASGGTALDDLLPPDAEAIATVVQRLADGGSRELRIRLTRRARP
jgi:hypothetical protein